MRFALLLMALLLALIGQSAAFADTKEAPLLLANEYRESIDPALYLVSEKFDGVRAVWDGKVLRFRSGRAVAAPAWFSAKLPATPLDGELWLARGQFDVASGMVRRTVPIDAEWQRLSYLVFELPGAPGSFAERAQQIKAIVAQANWPQLQAVEQVRVATRAQLKAKLAATVKAGGEGLMLHLADAPYATGRSDVLLKLKAARDAEATVLGHLPGKGKYQGLLGALDVKTPSGVRFKLGSGLSDAERRAPPPIGAQVTYTYRDLTPKGVPRFATFVRVRTEP
jgi:DNA ligase 1